MKYLQPKFTMPKAEPNPEMCCEACVFGSGKHAPFCTAGLRQAMRAGRELLEQGENTFPSLAADWMAAFRGRARGRVDR